MNDKQNQKLEETEKLKEIPKWLRRYVESRTAPIIIWHIVFIVSFGIAFLSVYYLSKGKFILAGLIYFNITWDKHKSRYFAKTGIPESRSVKQIRKFLSLPLIACIVISVIMEQRGVFPAHLSVPISALYVCPLLIFVNWQWARGSFIGYLWATLYGAWSIAILFKVPILTFSEGGQLKPGGEMYLAAPVTGLITGLVAYIYGRYALKKLKGITHLEGDTTNGV